MREIKFRSWNGEKLIQPVFEWGGMQKNNLLLRTFSNDFHAKWMYGIDAENVILEQFTGLHDRNGKEIYEGDILIYNDCPTLYFYVVFEYGQFFGSGESDDMYFDSIDEHDIEIIGNIHENQELIQK